MQSKFYGLCFPSACRRREGNTIHSLNSEQSLYFKPLNDFFIAMIAFLNNLVMKGINCEKIL